MALDTTLLVTEENFFGFRSLCATMNLAQYLAIEAGLKRDKDIEMAEPILDVICIGRSSVDLYGGQLAGVSRTCPVSPNILVAAPPISASAVPALA